jgi:hypothetical protein
LYSSAHVIHRFPFQGRTMSWPSCRQPRFPIHAHRNGDATISPYGVTLFW